MGYETYKKILNDAVRELKTQEFSDILDPETTSHEVAEDFSDIQLKTRRQSPDQDARTASRDIMKEGKNSAVVGHLFVEECNFECDLSLYFPEEYIPESSERIALYQELDSITRPGEIDAFCERLLDRFGPIPTEGIELIRVVALRQMARQLGFERLTLKQGIMVAYFCSTDMRYYESETFGRVLNFVTGHVKRCQLRDKNGKRSLLIRNIKSIQVGEELLRSIITGSEFPAKKS